MSIKIVPLSFQLLSSFDDHFEHSCTIRPVVVCFFKFFPCAFLFLRVKVVYIMSKADDQVINVARNRGETVDSATPKNVDSLWNELTCKWKRPVDGGKAKQLAESSWRQLCDRLQKEDSTSGGYAADKIAFLSCCNVWNPLDMRSGPNKDIVGRSIASGAILGIPEVFIAYSPMFTDQLIELNVRVFICSCNAILLIIIALYSSWLVELSATIMITTITAAATIDAGINHNHCDYWHCSLLL